MFILVGSSAHAGNSCEETVSSAGTMQKALELARRVSDRLDASGSQVALVARIGQDLSKYKLRFSHLGFVVRDHPDGRWSVVHDLNLCGTDLSQLYVQGIGNFFSDDLHEYEAALLLLPQDIQKKLEAFLVSTKQIKRFHEPKYSAVAYPFNTLYQNSNQWALEVLASVIAPEGDIATRAEAQRWLKEEGFEPTLLTIPALTRLGGRMFKANIAFNDHPDEFRWSDRIYVVTVDAMFDFLRKRYPENTRRVLVGLE
ncbi:MAG: DUF2145 domain-containing protein [Zoogloeaceae bacterium]|nr:DUF2145 domain-containing protein [Zoogloeaceae bacterium]